MDSKLSRRFGYRTNLGLSFIDSAGVQVRSFQLLNADKFAVAVADFDDHTLTRFEFADSATDASEWLDYVRARL